MAAEAAADVELMEMRVKESGHTQATDTNSSTRRTDLHTAADVNIKDEDGRTALHLAAENGNVDKVRHLINQGADINVKDEEGMTPLHWATYNQDANVVNDIMRYLVDHGADVNLKDDEGRTPLSRLIGSWYGFNSEMVRYLVDQGADVDTQDDAGLSQSGKTALHRAVEYGDVEAAKHLVDHGADANIKDNNGRTPLHHAAEKGNADAIKYLVDHGADVNVKDDCGMTPLHMAVAHSNVDIVKYLVDHGADVNIKNNMDMGGFSPLLWYMVMHCESTDVVAYLVDHGADVNIKDVEGESPLYYAALKGRHDMVRILTEHGADVNDIDEEGRKALVNAKDEDGRLALHTAAENGIVHKVRRLINQGADVNIKDDGGRTALHIAAENGNVETVRHLIDQGADVNIKDEEGMTPLHWATWADVNVVNDIMKYLVDHGADVNIKDDEGRTPLSQLIESWFRFRFEMVRYLVDRGADVNTKDEIFSQKTALHCAAEDGDVDTVKHLVDHGADANIKDLNGRTPLHCAAANGNADVIRYLVDHGADVNIKDGDLGMTPLHLAVMHSHPNIDIVKYLVGHGADVDPKSDKGGITPLGLSTIAVFNSEIVRYLADQGADINSQDDATQRTPFLNVVDTGDTDLVKHFIDLGADVNIQDVERATPLLLAIRGRHKDVAAILLENEKWKEMLSVADEEGTTAMRALIASMPDVAERALSRCVTTNEGSKKQVDAYTNWTMGAEEVHTTSRDFEVTLDYQFLEDFQDSCAPDVEASTQGTSDNSWRPKKFTKHNHILHLMDKHDCSILLKHPLVISLLEYKWTRFARYIFFGNLIFYLVFLSSLTAFGLVVLSPLERTCADVLSGSFNETVLEGCEGLSIHEYRFLFIGAAVTILTALLRLALEIVQFCRHPLEYLLDWVNWLEIPLYLFSIMFTFVFATPCLCVYSWQWQIGVIAVFLGWIGLITFLQKWPLTGVYVLMFVNIITSFLKIVFLALLLVIAFGLAFYMLLFEPDEMRTPFSHPARAIVKVMAMTIGELDYDSLSHQEEGEDEIAFLPVSLILWITFLVLMPVLLNNLLVGLAVGDVDYLQKTATESRTKLQIDLILNIEQLLQLLGIRHRYIIQSQTLFPNTPETLLPHCCKRGTTDHNLAHDSPSNTRPARFRRWIATQYSQWGNSNEYSTSGVKISDAITPPPDSLEKQLQKQRKHLESELKEQGEQFQEAVKQLSASHKEQVMKQVEEKMEEQLMQMMDNQTKKIEEQAKNMLDNHTEKMEKKMEEHTKNLEKQTEKMIEEQKRTKEMMAEQTEQLVGEVASLKEALEKLVSQMAMK